MMMATAAPPSSSSLLPLLESLEDDATGQTEQTDAYLTIANRLSGEEGRQFLPAVAKHFSRLGKSILVHITSSNADLSQAALQALGFCVYHSHIVSELQEPFTAEILSALCSLIVKSTDKNTCTRALWVISKQSFPADVIAKKTPSILTSLESVWSRDDIQSVVMEHEALNVVIRLLEQVPPQMGEGAVRWVKLVVPLVVHSASKVRLRAAAAMELGMSLLLDRQKEVAAIIEPMMSTKLIPELQKLFMSKNETNVLKLWPLFVKLLGKMLHRGGPFINSLLHLEELGFRSSSPTVKKIAFIAWKSLIDNFALNPDILCSSKRLRLLMQPLTSIHVRTEALLLTKVEVWWYLVVQLRHNLSPNFDQVSVPLLQSTLGCDVSSVPGTPSRSVGQNGASTPMSSGFNSPANSSRLSLNSSINVSSTFPSIQLLGLEMLLHYFLGPDAVGAAAKRKLVLSLEPLTHPLVSGVSSFTKHAAVLINNIGDGFINIGKEAPDSLLSLIWTNLIHFVNLTIESGGSKKERQGCEVLTLMLQTLQSVATSESLPADKVLLLLEATVTGIPPRVLGSASYQVGKMDVLNGTPALFLIQLLFNSSWMSTFIHDVRFFDCLQTLVGCGLSGPASPLVFAEAVLAAIRGSAAAVQSKEQLWRMWSVVVAPLTDTITQTNEVNQGDALEHNFSSVHAALMFPATHLLSDGSSPLQPASQRSMLSSWFKLYKVFARCSALVVTAEENVCCEELCAKMAAVLDRDALKVPSTLNAVGSFLQLMAECVDFSPYTPQFQQKLKSPHTPVNWTRKRNKALGNLSTFQSLLVQSLDVFLEEPEVAETTGVALVSVVSTLFSNLVLANAVRETLAALVRPLALFYEQAAKETTAFTAPLINKLEKLLSDVFACLQSRSTLAFDDDLLLLLSPLLCVVFLHRNKQLRTTVAHFWNASFANAVSLRYPDDLRPILSQVKQKVPIILPGFEVVCVSEELSGQYSSESSQMETKLSGVSVSSVGKRESLLNKSTEVKEKTSAKPVSMKLDFSSPKPPRRDVLEEEASIDFVFIPPETKERVLTEHQKEVKRTKRVDIPVMYNNLDASLDTTVFSQFTQSQDDSLDKPPAAQTDSAHKEAPVEVPHEEMETEDDTEVLTKDTQEYMSPTHATGNHQQGDVTTESADVSMEDEVKTDDKTTDAKDGSSPNVSGSSDLVSGTPQKPNSRRQTFITLEKYAEGKSLSPSSSSKFTGPLVKTSNSQKDNDATTASTDPKTTSQHPVTNITESPRRPKDAAMKTEPVRLTERLPSDTTEDEDVIPDTQTQPEEKNATTASSRDEEPDDSQTSPGDARRSGRSKVRPGADHDDKHLANKRRRSKAESDSQKTSPPSQSRPNTRSKAEEDSGRDRLRSRSHRDSSQNSHTRSHKKVRLYSSSQDFMDNPEPRRRSSSQTDLQSDSQSDESQSQGRRRRRSKAAVEADEEGGAKQKVTNDKKPTNETEEEKTERENEMKVVDPSSQEFELVEQNKDNEVTNESQVVGSSPETRNESQQQEEKQDSPTTESRDESKSESKDQSKTTDTIETKSNKLKLRESERHDDLSQDESQVVTPSDAQTLRRSRRSKVSSEAESEDKSESQDSQRLTRSNSQTGGRTRRSKAREDPTWTPESSQSLDHVGSSESQGRGRYSRRRSSQVGLESSESESSQVKENQPAPKKRGHKPRASLPSPVVPEPKDGNTDDTMKEADEPEDEETQKSEVKPEETQSSEAQHEAGSEKTPEIKDVTVSESRQETDAEEQSSETMMEVEASGETDDVKTTETLQEEKRDEDTLEPVNAAAAPPGDTAEELQVSESSDDKQTDETETNKDELDQVDPDYTSSQQEEAPPGGVSEEADDVNTQITEGQDEEPAADPEPGPSSVCDPGPGPEDVVVNLDAALTELCDASSSVDGKVVSDESPVKSKDLDAIVGPDVGQSPRTRGTWSPSASPSTSILKKGQKRPLHEDTPSPLVKSRRVSFADPIQQQETADDIDRRSPALRTSSPRRTKTSGIPQSKYITTPTKGLMMLSPRNMRSPGFKSSKKCLISEMSQEPRPVPRDCIYPPLVGCSAPVEAVLPQISSTMWSRGFGQLVRSRNIKTVGDLSALTPAEVKTLPVRSPKVSNVKKALKVYEQQRKGRGGDELKSFDETEMMTSEADETDAAHNHDDDKMAADDDDKMAADDDKMAAETLATALVDEPLADVTPQQEVDVSVTRTSVAAATVGRPEEEAEPRGSTLLSEAESLTCRMTSEELRRCSPQQLLHIHETLGDAMRRVVEEMKTRLSGTDGDGGR